MPDLTREMCPRLVNCLACPVCASPLYVGADGAHLACAAGADDGGSPGGVERRNRPNPPKLPQGKTHRFDGAAGGYVNLALHHSGGGDSKEAVRARTAFLSHGYYDTMAASIAAAVRDVTPPDGLVLDAGCGEGYYSNRIAETHPVMGVDLSKYAVDTAAKAARRARKGEESCTLYAVGSVFALPVMSERFDTVVNIFAPCAPAEYARVLRNGGHLVVVGAGERHLLGLKEFLYEDPYLNDPRRDLPGDDDPFVRVETRRVTDRITVEGSEDIAALFSMTPYYWRTPRDSRTRLASLDSLETEVAFDIHIYRKI